MLAKLVSLARHLNPINFGTSAIAAVLVLFCLPDAAIASGKAMVTVTATQKGGQALDRDEYGGNPFASALIQALNRRPQDNLYLIDLMRDFSELFSDNFQKLDVIGDISQIAIPLVPLSGMQNSKSSTSYAALVVVMAEYGWDNGLQPLPGAAFDAIRVSNALDEAGYVTHLAVIKNASEFKNELEAFGARTKDNDAALVYTTGHGTQIGEDIYLLDTEYKVANGKSDLDKHAINLTEIENILQAKYGNFILYGGCRDNPLSLPQKGSAND